MCPPSPYLRCLKTPVHLQLLSVLALSLSRFGIEGVWHGAAENRLKSITLQMFTPEIVSKKHITWKVYDFEKFSIVMEAAHSVCLEILVTLNK